MKKLILLMLISAKIHAAPIVPKETNCLAQVVFHEIRGGTKRAKQAVALTVLNRKQKRGKTICQVVFEKHQFSFTDTKLKIDKKTKDWKSVVEFTTDFLKNVPNDFTHGSTLFHNTKVKPNWDKTKIIKTIYSGGHIFYREI